MIFSKATKKQAKLRMALIGPSGSGKTYTALNIATHLGERVALIDTEHGSASLYSDAFDFDVVELASFNPRTYVEAIRAAEGAGYDVLAIDSLSHAWMGKDGVLEFNDKTGGDFNAWRKATPLHNELVEAMLAARLHVVATMRSKVEYVMEEYLDNGRKKTKPVKVGLAPVQRDGLDYEFTVTATLDHDNVLHIDKTRCPALTGQMYPRAGKEVADILSAWLSDGAPDLALLVSTLRSEYSRVRKLGGDLPPLTSERVASMSEMELEAAIHELREQAAELTREPDPRSRRAGALRS